MIQVAWDVSLFIGREVKIEISDGTPNKWKHISCDHIVFSDNSEISLPGRLAVEKWSDIVAFDVSGLVAADSFYEQPDAETWAESVFTSMAKYSGARIRGYLVAPETGNYTFWVSGSTGAELWLSKDDTKYDKQRLAILGGEVGTSSGGIPSNSSNLWDQFSSQMSEEVHLVAGEKYFVEMLSQQHHSTKRHIRMAWAGPGIERELVPTEVLSSYAREAEDADDDYLPDAWESQYGLDPTENGLLDRAHQGERGDFDLDGLSNREEYVYGTDPSNPDTDGDGLVDSVEVRNYNTDPTVSDAPSELLAGVVDLNTFSASEDWTLTSQGLIPPTFRGSVSWDFSVPGDGYWALNVSTSLLGDLYLHETVDIKVSIDGVSMGTSTLVYGQDRDALLRILTPYLTAGIHTLALDIENMSARRTVSIRGIEVLQPQGADLDGDGIPDWVFSQLAGSNTLYPYQPLSRTSPAFLEGNARMRSSVTLNGSAVFAGTDETHWYADLPLDPGTPTSFILSLEQGFAETGTVEWQETNVLESETLVIRKNDSLKLVAKPAAGTTGQAVAFTVGPINWAADAGAVASQSSTKYWGVASRAIDGNTSGVWGDSTTTHTSNTAGSWWKLDLGEDREIGSIVLWNRDGNAGKRLSNYRISILDSNESDVLTQDYHVSSSFSGTKEIWTLPSPVTGRFVKIELLGLNFLNDHFLSLTEVEVFSEGIDETLTSDAEHFTYQFVGAGTQIITATHADGSTGTLTVSVKQADFSETPRDLISNSVGNLQFTLGEVDSDLYFEGGSSVFVKNPATVSGDSLSLQASPRTVGSTNMLARLYEGGPILGVQPLNSIGVSDAIQNDLISSYASNDYPGYTVISTPIVLTDLPEGGSIVVRIYRAGVTFQDGATTLTLTAEDFVNGIYILEFLFPEGLSGGYCHYTDIYDRDGNFIGRR
ncbi:MAG: galactose-binding domain-containing protein [Luteolibacter sp.]